MHGREAMEKAYAGFFAKRPELKVESKTEAIRFLGRHRRRGGDLHRPRKDAPANSNRYSTLYVREGGRWLIAMLKEWGDETSRPSLEDLAWLIGTWESEGEGTRPASPTSGPNQGVHPEPVRPRPKEGEAPRCAGTQVIGVDPAEDIIRAWTFDPDGGFGEATWAWDGDRWAIESEGTLADGSRTTALNFLTPAGKDSFTWRSVRRTFDGEDLADIGPIKVNRVNEGK